MKHPASSVALVLVLGLSSQSQADCVTDAAAYHSVNEWVVRAILWNESGMRANAINRNTNGTFDVGIGQYNSRHFADLAKHGVTPNMLLDACTGTYVTAWHLASLFRELGNSWKAIGAYHSRTPLLNQAYANSVAITLAKWGRLEKGFLPFPGAPTSSAAAQKIMRPNGTVANNTRQVPTVDQSSLVSLSE